MSCLIASSSVARLDAMMMMMMMMMMMLFGIG